MIKINLNYNENNKKASLGSKISENVDVRSLNIPLWAICILIGYGPKFYYESQWSEEVEVKKTEVTEVLLKNKRLKRGSKGIQAEEKKLEEFKQAESEFIKKTQIVKEVLEKKNNPMRIMKYVSENIPKEVWIKNISLRNKKVKINGYALSFDKLNRFIKQLNTSTFLYKKVKLINHVTKTIKPSGKRVEEFFIESEVVKF